MATDHADKLYLTQLKSSPIQKFLSTKQLNSLFKLFDKDNDGTITQADLVKINAYIFKKFERIGASAIVSNTDEEDLDTEDYPSLELG